MIKKIILTIIAVLVLFLVCKLHNKTKYIQENKIIIATSADNPPYEFLSKNQIKGFDIDLVRELGRIMRRKVEIRNMDFSTLIQALKSNQVDMVIAGLSVTPERLKEVDFSETYYSTEVAALYNAAIDIDCVENISNLVVGAQIGSTFAIAAQKIFGLYTKEFKFLSSNLSLVEDLKNGRIDILILEKEQAKEFLKISPENLKYKLYQDSKYDFAIAMRKQSSLLAEVNQAIRTLYEKQNDADSYINQLKKKWNL